MKIYTVEVEDASHLGGSMGTEYTTTVAIKSFKTLEKAKKYGEGFGHWKEAEWNKESRKRQWYSDRGSYIVTIREEEVD